MCYRTLESCPPWVRRFSQKIVGSCRGTTAWPRSGGGVNAAHLRVCRIFLTGAPGSPGVQGGIDILDAHSGALRLRIFLPQQFTTDVDGLHGSFLATDEKGQRLFAITSSDGTAQNAALTIVQLAAVPLGISTIQPSTVSATGGATLTIRGSGFVSGVALTINGKAATVTFQDVNTLSVIVPALTSGPQQITITNPDGESVSLDAAITAN